MRRTSIAVDISVPNCARYLGLVGNIAECLVRDLEVHAGDPEQLAFHLNLVLTEAAGNAIRHGSPSATDTVLRVCIEISEADVCLRVFDHGAGFDLDTLEAPDPLALDEGGRGIMVIRSLMDSVVYRRTDDGNVLEMRKRLT
ncbi:MAG: ATP-binding protein [Methylotetracoccus sp.]